MSGGAGPIRRCASLFAASALAVALLAADAQAARAAEQVTLPDGRGIHLECRGHGSPTVILISGFPNAGDVWSLLDPGVKGPPAMAGIARLTRVCTYDRPNTVLQTGEPGRSDPVPQPRTAADTVADLHALTRAAELRGPYVLVGHSLGGLFARLYASTYPRRVAGIVEIDATYELLRDLISPEFWPGVAAETSNVPPGFESYDLDGVLDQMVRAAAARPLSPFLPLVVLSHGIPAELPDPPPPGFPDAATLERASTASQIALAKILPYAVRVVAARSGHYIQNAQPELVIDAVRRELEMLRPLRVRCRSVGGACRAKVRLAGGASNKKVTVRLPDAGLRLASVRPNRGSLRGTYGLGQSRMRGGGSRYEFRLDAAQTTPRGSRLELTFRTPLGGR